MTAGGGEVRRGVAGGVHRGGVSTGIELIEPGYPSVSPDADVPEIARVMTDYNLISMPVVDGDGRILGAITVDDVLELTLPSDWRRRFGVARG